jgi:hypothetical protein
MSIFIYINIIAFGFILIGRANGHAFDLLTKCRTKGKEAFQQKKKKKWSHLLAETRIGI